MIPQIGWRATYVVFGAALIAVMVPLGVTFYRSRLPEAYGLTPDNQSGWRTGGAKSAVLVQ